MRWLFVTAVLFLGIMTIPVSASGRRAYYSTCYTPTYYYPSYSYSYPAYTAPAYTAPAVPAYSNDWKAEVVRYAEKRDDLALFQKTLQALGISYAGTPHVSSEVAYPGQANSLYGYSYSTIKEAYGALDMNQLFQTQARLAAGTKEAMSEANAAFATNIGVVSDAQSRVAEILAKGKAVEASLLAANAQPSAKTTQTTTIVQPTVADPGMQAFLRDVAVPACSSCHSGPNAKAKMDINLYPTFTPAQKNLILERLTTTDLSKRMPRLPDGKAGTLSAEGIKGFATH